MNKRRKDFNSMQDYIYYLVNEKNVINGKNITLFIICIGVIAILSINLLNSSLKKENPFIAEEFTYDYMIETLVNQGYEESELLEMDENRIISLFNEVFYNTNNQEAGNTKNKEYPSSLSQALKQDYYVLASKGDFKSIVSDFENKKLEYSFSELHNKDIINIYNDAYYLDTSIGKNDLYLESQVLKNIKDPQMLLYGVLLSREEARRDVVKDKVSLSPILINNNIRVTKVSSGSLESAYKSEEFKNDIRFKEVAKYINEGDYIIYRFNFTIDDNDLNAYIFKDMSTLNISFYGMYSPTGISNNYNYLTILEWINLDNVLNGVSSTTPQNNNTNNNTNNNISNNEPQEDEIINEDSNNINNIENGEIDSTIDNTVEQE